MLRPNTILATALLASLVGATVYGASILAAQKIQLQSLAARIADLSQQLTDVRSEHQSTAHEVQLAETQLTQLTTPLPATQAGPRDTEIRAWLARVTQLHKLLAADRSANIPECSLLTVEDWFTVARTAAFETDEQRRKALAALRIAAKRRFANQLSVALRKFMEFHNNALPDALLDLAPYLTKRAQSSIVPRYTITHDGSLRILRGGWIIREATAVDADYDSRLIVSPGSTIFSPGPAAWIDDFAPRMRRAKQAYAAANPAALPLNPGLAQLAPFIDPPLAPATLEKLLRAERDRTP